MNYRIKQQYGYFVIKREFEEAKECIENFKPVIHEYK